MEWQAGNPPRFGYYLATWLAGPFRKPMVSELWFNDSNKYWSSSRGYLDNSGCHIDTVVAWMPMPEPYE